MKGLTTKEVIELQKLYGKNELTNTKKKNTFIKIIKIICEPMFLLLLSSALIYFLLGEITDGFVMLISISGVICIEIYEEIKTDKTLEKLKELSSPKVMVYRNNRKQEINSSDLVPGDVMIIHEGLKIAADGKIIKCSGLSIDESTLTGETIGEWKDTLDRSAGHFKTNFVYAGTLVLQGSGVIIVTSIGNETEYGKIGKSISKIDDEKTPLQMQINKLVKYSVILTLILFSLVFIVTFVNLNGLSIEDKLIHSLLSSITLAIAIIPEEFPVILAVFLSMGAWRLAKNKAIVKKLSSVETLGSISTLCVDKTGTITENNMKVKSIWAYSTKDELIMNMKNACNDLIYDPMEKAMIQYAAENHYHTTEEKVKDYPFSNDLKIMGIVKKNNKGYLLSVKGSLSGILKYCHLKDEKKIKNKAESLAKEGLRVIAVASKTYSSASKLPKDYDDFSLNFDGLIGLYDPPRKSINEDIKKCYDAGINIIMITGDNGLTAAKIGKSIGMKNYETVITGAEIDKMSMQELQKAVKKCHIFSRVIPNQKLKIIEALKANGEVVAMTGDGVNDAPALKKADIGIAMGNKGSEVSREAADLILLDDNFSTIINTIKDGRRIYDNIKKAVGYIITIHIPIMLSSLVAPLMGILPQDLLLLPIHIVMLELIIDPTCSIILERQPAETDIMNRKPRKANANIVNIKEFVNSAMQGILLFLGSFTVYYLCVKSGNVALGRTMGLLIIMIGNFFLVEVCSSSKELAYHNFKNLLKDKVFMGINILMIILLLIIIYTPIRSFFKFTTLSFTNFIVAIIIAFICTFSYEIMKIVNKDKKL